MKDSKAKKGSKSPKKGKNKSKSSTKHKKKNSKSPKHKTGDKSKSKNSPKPKSKSPQKDKPKEKSKGSKSPKTSKNKSKKSKSLKKNKSTSKSRSKSPKNKKSKSLKKSKSASKSSTSRSKSPKNKKSKSLRKSKSASKSTSRSKSPKNKKSKSLKKSQSTSKIKSRSKSPKNKKSKSPSKGSRQHSKKSKSSSKKGKKKRSHGPPKNSPSTIAFQLPPSEASESSKEEFPTTPTSRKQSSENSNFPKEGQELASESQEPAIKDGQINASANMNDNNLLLIDPSIPEQNKNKERRRYGSLDDSQRNDLLTPTAGQGIPGISGYYQNEGRRKSSSRSADKKFPPTVGAVVEQTKRGSTDCPLPDPNDPNHPSSKRGSVNTDGIPVSVADSNIFDMTLYQHKLNMKSAFRDHKAHLITPHTLYKEALYTSVHYLGVPTVRFPSTTEDLCLYSHVAFKVEPKVQVTAMQHVVGEAFPLTVVNTKVRRADGVEARDGNVLPDPYCIVAVETQEALVDFQVDKPEWEQITPNTPLRPKQPKSLGESKGQTRPPPDKRMDQTYKKVPAHIKTSIQSKTDKPVWDQRFQCLALRPSIDILTIELWDNEEEAGSTGKRKSSKKPDIFLGLVSVPVREIPCEGESKWHFITGKTHRKKDAAGRLLLEVWLTHAYRHGKNYEEYGEPRIVLEMLWDHILNFESTRYGGEWNGDIPPAAICLLFQYALQTGISEASQAIIRWNAYTKYNLSLFAVERRLTELENSLERAKDWKDVRQYELESNMTMVAVEKILPVIRNHLNETQERVREAVKAIKHCQDILKKFHCKESLFKVQCWIEAEIRMAALEWYQAKYFEYLGNACKNKNSVKSSDAVESLARLLNAVNTLMRECLNKWRPLFWLDGLIDYMPIVYDEFQKMIIHDVETMCWYTLQYYDTNTKLRTVLQNLDSDARRLCRALFDLYVQTQVFVLDQDTIFECDPRGKNKGSVERYYHMNRYHRWFRPVLVLWLGYALIKAADMISTSIRIDNVIVENEQMLTSSSAADAGLVYNQLSSFWKELNWPDIAEGYVILHYLFEVMCFVTIMYARLKRSKLEKEGYFDTVDRFDISQRLCTALNNIEFVKESLVKIPDDTNMDNILVDLDKAVGDSFARAHRFRISNLLTGTLVHVEVQFKKILIGIADRVRPELRERFHQSFLLLEDPKTTDDDTLVPVLTYLEDNIVILYKSLLELNFIRVLQMFWNVTCQEILHHLKIYTKQHQKELKQNQENTYSLTKPRDPFYQRINNIISILIVYFEGGCGGLNETEIDTKHYKHLKLFLSCLTLPSKVLIATYYREAAEEQMEITEPSKLGTLTVRVNYHMGALNVEVISAKNLSARDEPLPFFHWCRKKEDSSDPQVEISLMPPQNFQVQKQEKNTTFSSNAIPNPKIQDLKLNSHKTDIKWKSQNPVFNQKFKWHVSEDECTKLDSVLVFTVRDFDLLSRDDFLGQAIVPIAQMPGLMKFRPVPQPMHLQLQSVDVKHNPIISILANRAGDYQAQTFTSEQEKFVVAITSHSSHTNGAPLRLARGSINK